MSEFQFRLKRQKEVIFNAGPELTLTLLADLNQTIDDLFTFLLKTKRESDLEKLCPYFGTLWPSARGLSKVAIDLITPTRPHSPPRVLELGCGLAVPSLLLAQRGCTVLATDVHPEVPHFLAKNIENNQIESGALQYLELAWQDLAAPDLAASATPALFAPDWIIASDVLYEAYHAKTLALALRHLVLPHTKILLADPARPYLQLFSDEMRGAGFTQDSLQIIKVPDTANPIDAKNPASKEIFVLSFS